MYSTIVYTLLLFVLKSECATITMPENVDEKGFRYYQNIGWIHYNPVPTTWRDARLRCHLQGATLMSPNNERMQKIMTDLTTTAMWTGVHATESKGNYFSLEGKPLSHLPITWAKDEPDDADNNEECLIMLHGGEMADCSCNATYPFACYKANNDKTDDCGHLTGYEFNQVTQSCYKFHNVAQNWSRAFMTCAEEGAHLAVIDTKGETEVLKELFSNYPEAKIVKQVVDKDYITLGFYDWENHELWMTINGKNIADLVNDKIAFWHKGEPNRGGDNEYYGSMHREGGLNDVNSYKTFPFICEYEKN